MKLYQINSTFLGKDLQETRQIELVALSNDKDVFNYIDKNYMYEEWLERYSDNYDNENEVLESIMKNSGDVEEEYMGEFYDEKYSWVCLGDITDIETATLKKLGLLKD